MLRKLHTWATSSLRRKLILLMMAVIIPLLGVYIWYGEQTRAQTFEETQLAKAKAMALSGAEAVSYALETALATEQLTREQIFDTNYQPIPDTNPQKYHTAYDSFTDANLLRIHDKYREDQDVLYAVAADINGYVPTHNTLDSRPLTGDYNTDLSGNRTKRLFNDPVGLAAVRSTESYLWQFYTRDNGQLGWDVSAPIMVQGEHWGAYRIGLRLDRLNEAKLNMLARDLLGAGLFTLAVVIVLFFVVRRSTRPLGMLGEAAAKVASGDFKQSVAVTSRDEIGTLSTAFNSMTGQIRSMVATLEERVEARTAQLRASAEVGRAATSILESEQLLKQVANLITERFGFYYAAVFLLNETRQVAVLRAATGEAGRTLLEQSHQLAVNSESMVGTAIVTRRARIALDVGEGAVRFANPLLPDTRSEIALPLRVGDRVLGALDVQSEQVGAFDEASAEVLQIMADQVAVALFNAETFKHSERQAQTLTLLNQLSRNLATATSLEDIATIVTPTVVGLLGPQQLAVTQKTANPQILALREFTGDPAQPVGDVQSIQTANSLIGACLERGETIYTPDLSKLVNEYSDIAAFYRSGQRAAVILPLRVGDRSLGTLSVGGENPDAYSAEHINQLEQIASQLAITIENLNLAEQTQQTLAELDTANRQLIGQAWDQYTRTTRLVAAEWRNGQWTVSSKRTSPPETAHAVVAAPQALSLPIKVRGATIGEFNITATETDLVWNTEEKDFAQALIDQVGQVLENARLIDETERLAQREKAVADAADKIHRSTDIESVLQSAVAELRRITGRNAISVQLGFGRADRASGHPAEAEGDR